MLLLMLIGGIDTTWTALGASLWHLATHPDDQARLRAEPELVDTALEEFLRFYAPVEIGRIADGRHGPRRLPDRRGRPRLVTVPGRQPRPSPVP